MRAFEIYVRDNEVKCDIPSIHVPPYTEEDFAVYLKSDIVTKYKMNNLRFSDNSKAWLTQQRLNDSTIILHDTNDSPSKPKFTVSLTPRQGNPKVTKLDPRVVNEP